MSDVTIPEGIPADIWETACASVDEWSASSSSHPNIARRIIARAILAERERAARIVEESPQHMDGCSLSYAADDIASAIRSSHE